MNITEQHVIKMLAAQDAAAKEFWAYPNPEWQSQFQADWLMEALGVREAKGPDGLWWGRDD